MSTGSTNGNIAHVNNIDLYYQTVGKGRPILLMHGGLGLDHTYLRPWFDVLSQTGQVIYYDHRGNGRSQAITAPDEIDFDVLVSDAAALVEALGHDRIVLIGHSYGGFIAQAFAAAHPDMLSGLVLLSTVPTMDYQPTVSGTGEQMAAFGKLFSQPMSSDAEFRETWRQVVQMYFRDYDTETGDDLDARTRYSHMAWNAAVSMLSDFNMLEALPQIEVPTLVISGRHDPITPAGPGGERIAKLMPNATAITCESSAHYPFIEEETDVMSDIAAWIGKLA
ncbi:alpha/beta fold hydrolase [Hoeflea sp.]|uniref:alpha/beta fold hydrolase n=1 Tax=Hoeflea sp. TaxID=1940281 RepID=UPI003B025644